RFGREVRPGHGTLDRVPAAIAWHGGAPDCGFRSRELTGCRGRLLANEQGGGTEISPEGRVACPKRTAASTQAPCDPGSWEAGRVERSAVIAPPRSPAEKRNPFLWICRRTGRGQ